MSIPSTLGAINRLSMAEKRQIYARIIPPDIIDQFHISPFLVDRNGNDLLHLKASPGSSSVEMSFYHQYNFPDPVLYGHIADTINGNLHILLYVLNNPDSPRYDVDRLSDGTPTRFGIQYRNQNAELAALAAGLNPGQIRKGFHLLGKAIESFEYFVAELGHEIYFAEPLYYHNAIIFEKFGFAYQQGQRRMLAINARFSPTGDLIEQLDNSSPFRTPKAADSIRLRSWAIHDGILGMPFTDITMYKHVGKHAGENTAKCPW